MYPDCGNYHVSCQSLLYFVCACVCVCVCAHACVRVCVCMRVGVGYFMISVARLYSIKW
jgi:hypothetical protein